MCHSPPPLHPHPLHLHHFRLVCFSNFWINGEALHPTGLCLIWFKATIFSLDPILPCSITFSTLMSRCLLAHHLVIQKEVDELLAKGAIELSSGGARFYSSVFVVPKHTGGLRPILNLKRFNRYMHIPSFKMPTLKTVWQLIQQGDYAFSIDLQDAYLHVPIVKHHCRFLRFVWHNVPYQFILPFGLATAPRVFTSLTKPILFLCHHKGLHIWMISWSLFALSGQVKGHTCFCVTCWSVLVYISIFPSQTFASLSPLPFWGCVGILSTCRYLYLLISWLTFSS